MPARPTTAPSADEDELLSDAPPVADGRHRVRPQLVVLVLALLVAQFVAIGLWEAWRDAPTNDEPITIAAGVTALTRHDLRINSEHPPLPKVVAALPVLLAHPIVPNGPGWRHGTGAFGAAFVQANEQAGKLRQIVFLSRILPLLEGALVGLAIFWLASQLCSELAGLVAAGAWYTTAVVLAFSHLDGLDVPMALVTVAASLAVLHHGRRRTWASAALVGVIGGIALLTRWTGLALVPALAVIVVVLERRPTRLTLLRGASVLLIAWGTLWVGYRAIAPRSAPVVNGVLVDLHREHAVAPEGLSDRVLDLVPWPKEYRAGLHEQRVIERVVIGDHAQAFVLGHYWTGTRWWFWPATLLVKFPASLLLFLLLAPFGLWSLRGPRLRNMLLVVVFPAVVLAAATYLQTPQTIGVRYLLPVLALVIVAASPVVHLVRGRRPLLFLGAATVAAQLVFFATAVPESIAWTAPPFRPGYRFASDSSFDLGQDFWRARTWSEGRHPRVAWFGALPASWFPGARPLLSVKPSTIRGTVVVNANALVLPYHDALSWLRAYCPVQTIGKTVLVYRFDTPPDARPGPDAPAKPCRGTVSRRTD